MQTEMLALREKIPAEYSERHLDDLEVLVTHYEEVLGRVAAESNNCAYYKSQLAHIEEELRNARYGKDDRQRSRAFYKAADNFRQDLEGFASRYSGI